MTLTDSLFNSEPNHCETFLSSSENNATIVSQAMELSKDVLADIMRFRRFSNSPTTCAGPSCPKCSSPHLTKIASAVLKKEPITFVLPAFPGKSPNPAKVLGTLPDMAERCALEFLQHLCDRIQQYYAPGAQIILCSDGRVFSDVVGMRDEDVTRYQNEILRLIKQLDLNSILTFNLEEGYAGLSFEEMRSRLMEQYGENLETLKASVSRGKSPESSLDEQDAHRLYCGITRFLLEDSDFPGQTKSRSSLQKECRNRAYSVILRSQAWSGFIEKHFPMAIRLSIHPQSCGSQKLGIRLIEPDNWQTPWHGVAVYVGGRYMLLKRSQAEALGAHLVMRSGRPSHYILAEQEKIFQAIEVENET